MRDIPNVEALYFTIVNSNKRSITLDTKTPEGKEIMEKLIRGADVLVENFAPGAMDRMGLSWEHIQELNPRLIFGSIKGFGENSRFSDLKVYDNVAQAAGGSCSTTGFWDGPLRDVLVVQGRVPEYARRRRDHQHRVDSGVSAELQSSGVRRHQRRHCHFHQGFC